ncbi:hypothetical protein [Streptomyces sp. NPDC006631]|uniref:hypothetical protein n=1 Tax=Streptomyces sp. NPDC006631 TaxID=3364752 RepID=UPI00369DD691
MTKDDRPTLNLGHLAIPNVSTGQEWLKNQGTQREKALQVVEKAAREWLSGDFSYLPDVFFEMFAEKVVTALDHQV